MQLFAGQLLPELAFLTRSRPAIVQRRAPPLHNPSNAPKPTGQHGISTHGNHGKRIGNATNVRRWKIAAKWQTDHPLDHVLGHRQRIMIDF